MLFSIASRVVVAVFVTLVAVAGLAVFALYLVAACVFLIATDSQVPGTR